MKIQILLVFFLTTLIPVSKAANYGDLIGGKFDPSSRKDRAEIAASLEAELQNLNQYLPIQKPEEQVWLKEENAAIDSINDKEAKKSRFTKLVLSPEFNHAKLHENLSSLLNSLTCASNLKISTSKEMTCWSVASLTLTDSSMFNDTISNLIQNGRLSKNDTENVVNPIGPNGYGFFYNVYGRGILSYILIPYLIKNSK